MYRDLCAIEVDGPMLSSPTRFQLFENEKQCLSLIYGKNGSGKSTIARSVECCSEKIMHDGIVSNFCSNSGTKAQLDSKQKNSIYIFNEGYVERTVKLKQDGLETIILFGEQGDLSERIEKAKSELDKADEARNAQDLIYSEYLRNNNVRSPDKHWNLLCEALKGPGSWAEKDAKIKGLRQNSSVTNIVAKEIAELKISAHLKELQTDFDETMNILRGVSSDDEKIESNLKTIVLGSGDESITSLLEYKVEEPVITERDKYLMSLVHDRGQQYYLEVKTYFEQPEHNHCPYCLRVIEDIDKIDLIDRIKGIMSDAVREHILQLDEISLPVISFSEDHFQKLNSNQVHITKTAIDELNKKVEHCKKLIIDKKNNIYTPVFCRNQAGTSSLGVEAAVNDANEEIIKLNQLIDSYNKSITDRQIIKNKALRINKEIASLYIASIYKTYKKQIQEKVAQEEKLRELENIAKAKMEIHEELLQKLKSTQLACDKINQSLQYIFFSNSRLNVEPEGEHYIVKSNGKSVRPSDISIGERNAMALCYFMIDICNGMKEKELHNNAVFLILDDPITSFDKENRVGVLSFLKSKLAGILKGNNQSRFIILSHDLSTIFDMEKICRDILKSVNIGKLKAEHYQMKIAELTQWKITPFSYKGNEYSSLLQMVYRFGNDESDGYDPFIGNVMRRILEAFATFEYRKGIDEVSCDSAILNSFVEEEYKVYFENLMYRLVLNSESHTRDGVTSMDNIYFYDAVSLEEKKRTARDIICFMHLLNPEHVRSHLEKNKDMLTTIERWEKLILA